MFLLIPLLILIVVLFILLQRPGQVDIPAELVGITYDDAVELLEEHSLLLGEKIEQANDDVEEGIVFQTSPDSGATVREGTEVDLYVSLGEEPFIMEDYEDEEYEVIRAELSELGFTIENEKESSETVPAGYIIAQDIEPGEEVLISETTITFTVSTGRPVMELRDLSEYNRTSVDDYVSERGLNLTADQESSEDIPAGQVISQDPAPGTSVYSGDRITVVFSTGPEEVSDINFSHQITIPYEEQLAETEENQENDNEDENGSENEEEGQEESEEPELLPNDIQIYIDDLENDMDTVADEFTITEDREYSLNFIVEEGSSATYRVMRDGEEIMRESVSP